MILNVHSNASYLFVSKGKSHNGGYFLLGSLPVNDEPIKFNRNIAITCEIFKLVTESADEA